MADFFQTATPYLTLALIGLGWLYRREYEKRRDIEKQVSERKYNAYLALINVIIDMSKAGTSGRSQERLRTQIQDRMIDALKELMLYSTDDILRLVQTWLKEARGGTVKLIRLGEMIVAIRKDMGNPKTKVTAEDVLRMLLPEYDQAKAEGLLEQHRPPVG